MVTRAINLCLRGQTKNNLTRPWVQFNPYADIFIIITDKPPSFIVFVNEKRMRSHDLIVCIQILGGG